MTFEEQQKLALAWQQGHTAAIEGVRQGAAATEAQYQQFFAQAVPQAEAAARAAVAYEQRTVLDRLAANHQRLAKKTGFELNAEQGRNIANHLEASYGVKPETFALALLHDHRAAHALADAAGAGYVARENNALRAELNRRENEERERKEREAPGYRPHLPKRPYGASVSDWENSGRVTNWLTNNHPWLDDREIPDAQPQDEVGDLVRGFVSENKRYAR